MALPSTGVQGVDARFLSLQVPLIGTQFRLSSMRVKKPAAVSNARSDVERFDRQCVG